MSVIAGRSGNGSGLLLARRASGRLVAVSLLASLAVVAPQWSPTVARAQLPSYGGVDPALTASLAAQAQRAADGLLVPGEPGGESGTVPSPVGSDGGDQAAVHVPQEQVLAGVLGSSEPADEGETSMVPEGYVEGESVLVAGSPTSLTYENPDGSFTKQVFSAPVVFPDGSGSWTQFDPQPVDTGDRLEVPDAKVDTSFADGGADPLLVQVARGSRTAGFALVGAADVPAVATDSGVVFSQILPGVDLVEHSVLDGVKEELVVHSLPGEAPTYRFRLSTTGLSPRSTSDGGVELVDASGQVVFRVPEGTGWDSNTAQPEEMNRVPVVTRLVQEGDEWFIEMTPDWQWMSDPARVFPLVIDPQFVSGSATGRSDAWVWYQNPNVRYDGTSGTYSQWSASWNNYVSRIGETYVSGVWHKYRTYMYFGLGLPSSTTHTITSATLTADVIWVRDYSSTGVVTIPAGYASQIGMYRVTSPWGPAKAAANLTWNVQPTYATSDWQQVGASQSGNMTANVTAWAQMWDNDASTNNGVMFAGLGHSLPGQNHGFTVFTAVESSAPPVLTVTYTNNPVPAAPSDLYATHLADGQQLTFSWTDADPVTDEVVQVCADDAFTLNCQLSATATNTAGSFTVSMPAGVLLQNVQSHWRVRKNFNGTYAYSVPRRFTLNNVAPPSASPPSSLGVDGFMSTTTTSISVPAVTDADGDTVWYKFKACTKPGGLGTCEDSGWLSTQAWTANLPWAQRYYWQVWTWDKLANGLVGQPGPSSTAPNDDFGSTQWTLGTYPAGAPSGNVELASGNLMFESTDLDPASVGVSISATRSYNSRDPRKTGLFGAGWSHQADMWLEFRSSNGIVHMADGSEEFFGLTNGTFQAAWGSGASLSGNQTDGYTYTAASGVKYHFAHKSGTNPLGQVTTIYGELDGIKDPATPVQVTPENLSAYSVTFARSGSTLVVKDHVTSRSLTYQFATPSDATAPHVVSVTPSGASGEEWTYQYSADKLVKACSPDVDTSSPVHTMCTEYRYDDTTKPELISAVWSPQTKTGTALEPVISTQYKVLFSVTYDAYGQVASQSNGVGNTITYSYSTVAAPVPSPADGATSGVARYKVSATVSGSGVTDYYFDASRRLIYRLGAHQPGQPGGPEQWFEYSSRGFLFKTSVRLVADPVPSGVQGFATTQFDTDTQGRVVKRIDPNGAVWTFDFNAQGRVTRQVDPYGLVVDTEYAADGVHPVAVHRRAAPAAGFSGATLAHGDANTTYSYTSTWQIASRTDELGQVTTFQYNSSLDLSSVTSGSQALGYVYTRYTYDALGRKLTTETSADNLTWTTLEQNTYDLAGRLTVTDGPATSDAVTGDAHRLRVTTTYDDSGNPLTITKSDIGGSATPDASRTVSYHYDDAGRQDRYTDALGNSTDKVYDSAGNVHETIDARGTHVVFDHDYDGHETTTTLMDFVDDPIDNPGQTRDVVLSSKEYDLSGRLVTETDSRGRVTTTTYDPNGMGWAVEVDLAWGGESNVLAATAYDLVGRMTDVWRYGTPNSSTSTFVQHTSTLYDLWGRATVATIYDTASNGDGGGTSDRAVTTTYDVSGKALTVTTTGPGVSRAVTNQYQANGLLISATVENGATDITTSQSYDARGRVIAAVDANGNTTTFAYDVLDRQVSTAAPSATVYSINRDAGTATSTAANAVTTVGYDTFGDVSHVRNAMGEITTTAYDLDGRRSVITYPSYAPPGSATVVVPTESFTYDAVGNLVATTNRMGETTGFTFDMMSRVVRRTDPAVGTAAAGTVRYTYDDGGNLTSTTNQVGAVTLASYDYMNQVATSTVKVRHSDGSVESNISTVIRDKAGRPIQTCQPTVNGETPCSTVEYSPFGLVVRTTDPLGQATSYYYDGLGQQVSVSDTAGHRIITGYDPAGRVSSVTHKGTDGVVVDSTISTRDQNGNVTHVNLPGGGQMNYSYDARNRMTTVQQLKAVSPTAEWMTVSYGFDNLNRQVSTTDGRGYQWLTTYNALGLVQDQIEPSTVGQEGISDRRFTTVYDAAGLVVEYRQPGGVEVNYSYDELARVVVESSAVTAASAAATASFGYDAAGRLTSFSAPQGDVTLTYDDRNLLMSASGEGVASSFVYDARGRMTERSDAAGVSQYLWDAADRLVADTEPLTNTTRTYTWNSSNQVTGVSYSAGGMQRAYSYDTAGRLVSDTFTGDNTTQRQSLYAYDSAGRLASETVSGTASVVGQGVNSYSYDMAGRLVSWTSPSATTTTYGWDDNGNRTSNGAVTSTYDARNRLTGSSNGDSYAWSARGTMASQTIGGQTSEYSFDGLGRMVSAAGVGLHYDAIDRLAERSDGNGGWLAFSYSGTGLQPVADGVGLVARTPGGSPVAVKVGSQTAVSVGSDRHGDVVATFDPNAGTIQGSVDFDPFGEVTSSAGLQAGAVGFQGAYTDPTTKLVDMGSRWYQPTTGRFTARDTIRPMLGSPISLNMYTYANDDPLGFFDPDGRSSTDTASAKARADATRSQQTKNAALAQALSVLHSNYAIFDTAAHGGEGDGVVSRNDLLALLRPGHASALKQAARVLLAYGETRGWKDIGGCLSQTNPCGLDKKMFKHLTSRVLGWDDSPGFFDGFFGKAKDTLQGLACMANSQCGGPAFVHAVTHPKETVQAVVDGVTNKKYCSMETKMQCAGAFSWDLLTFAFLRGAGKAGSGGAEASGAEAAAAEAAAAEAAAAKAAAAEAAATEASGAGAAAAEAAGAEAAIEAAAPSAGQLAEAVARATGGTLKQLPKGYSITVPNGTRGIVVRIMEWGGRRTTYYRVSVPGKEAFTIEGVASVDRALTHIGISSSSLEDIMRIIKAAGE